MILERPATTESSPLVEVRNASKWFGPLMALNGISLEIGPGITGLVGPNGAGKTTLLKLLTGQSQPSLGEIQVCGHDAWLAKAKAHVGFCPYGDATWDELSGRRLVRVTAGLLKLGAFVATVATGVQVPIPTSFPFLDALQQQCGE